MMGPPEQSVSMVPTYRTAPIKLRFELEARDLESAMTFHRRRSPLQAAMPRIGVIMMVAGPVASLAIDSVGNLTGLFMLFMGGLLSGVPLLLRRAARKHFQRLPRAQRDIEYALSEEHLRVSDGRSQTELPWNEVGGVASDAQALYWWTAPQVIHPVPVRAFQSPEAMREVVAFMERKLPKGAARARTGGGRRRFFLLTFGLWLVLLLMFVAIYHVVTQPVGG